jgi:hypothetical protein
MEEISKLPGDANSSAPVIYPEVAGKHFTRKPFFVFDINHVVFPSQPDESFRVKHSLSRKEDETILWVESKKSHQQWQCAISDIKSSDPPGIELPKEIVFGAAKKAILESESRQGAKSATSEAPFADLVICNGGIELIIEMSLWGLRVYRYIFQLLPVALDPVDILSSQLRDTRDEIARLQGRNQEAVCLNVTMKQDCNHQQFVSWGRPDDTISTEYFNLSSDGTTITIIEDGFYNIHINLVFLISGGNSAGIYLKLNDKSIQANQVRWQRSQYDIPLVISCGVPLKANDCLKVHYLNSSGQAIPHQTFNFLNPTEFERVNTLSISAHLFKSSSARS